MSYKQRSYTHQSSFARTKGVALTIGLSILLVSSTAFAACNLTSGNGIACVQSNSSTINASSGSIAFSNNNTAGNLIVVVLFANGADTSTPSDSRNTYSAAVLNQHAGTASDSDRLSIYYAENIGAGANTISVSAPGATQLQVIIFEYSGPATAGALDQAAGASGINTSPASPSVSTNDAPELVVGAEVRATSGMISAGNGYTRELCRSSCNNGNTGTEDRILSTTQTLVATWGGGNVGKWAAGIATFRTCGAPHAACTPAYYAQLPQTWVNNHAADGPYDVTRTLCHTGCNYTDTMADLNRSTNDWAVAGDQSWHIVVTAGTVITGSTGTGVNSQWTWPSKCLTVVGNSCTAKPTKFIVYESSTPNASGQGVCTHATSTPTVSQRNPGCNTTNNDLAKMWSIHSVTVNPNGGEGAVINMAGPNPDSQNGDGPSHIVLKDAEITSCAGSGGGSCPVNNNGNQYSLISTESPGPSSQSSCPQGVTLPCPSQENEPTDLGFERNYVHSDYGDAGTSANKSMVINAIKNACSNCWFMWNYFDQLAATGAESHIFGNTDAGPTVKVIGNWFEGSSIPMFSGGGAPAVGSHVPSDFEIRKNMFTHNPAWMPLACSVGLDIKSNGEMKVGIRYLYDANEFAYSNDCGQDGQDFTVTVRASSAGVPVDNYTAVIRDLTFSNNVLHAAGNGAQGSGRSGGAQAGVVVSLPGRYWTEINNLWYDISNDPINHSGLTPTYISRIASSGSTWTCPTVSRTTGVATMTCTDGGTGLHQTDMAPGDPVLVTTCTDTSLNTPTGKLGPFALTGTNGLQANGLTIVYPSPGSDVSYAAETCTLSNSNGWPQFYSFIHNTVIAQGEGQDKIEMPTTSSSKTAPDYMQSSVYRDNLIAVDPDPTKGVWVGWTGGGTSEGANTEEIWDTQTLTDDHMTFPGRSSKQANYLQCDGTGTCVAGNDHSSTLWFPADVKCTTSPVGSQDCIGLAGMMTGVFLLNSPNPFTDYMLQPYPTGGNQGSPYAAGGARQASDGTDLGADLNAIQNGRSETKYSGCIQEQTNDKHYCGSTGPYPD